MNKKRIKNLNPKEDGFAAAKPLVEAGFSNPPVNTSARNALPRRSFAKSETKCVSILNEVEGAGPTSPISLICLPLRPRRLGGWYHVTYSHPSNARTPARAVTTRARKSVKKCDFLRAANSRKYHEIKELQKSNRQKKITPPKFSSNLKMAEKRIKSNQTKTQTGGISSIRNIGESEKWKLKPLPLNRKI